jgi:hypothetical protein
MQLGKNKVWSILDTNSYFCQTNGMQNFVIEQEGG